MENCFQDDSRNIPNPPTGSRHKRVKFGIFSLAAIIIACLIFYAGIWYAKGNLNHLPEEENKREYITPVMENWQDRFLYSSFNYFSLQSEKPVKPDTHSISFDGTNEKKHQILCNGQEVNFFWNITRSVDGKTIAFLLPSKEQEAINPNWENDLKERKKPFTQGTIFLFDLEKNNCQSLGITADDLYKQSMAFSPDGQYLAYISSGLHLYNFLTKEDRKLTQDDGSISSNTIITGPLLWNSTGSAIYTAISEKLDYQKGMPTYLYKININDDIKTQSESVKTNVSSENLAKKEVILKLADLYEDIEGNTQEGTNPPIDDPLIYAVSPDENLVAFLQNKNLVIKNLKDSSINQIWEQRDPNTQCAARPLSVYWAPNGWIYFSISSVGCGSGIGDIWASFNGAIPERIVEGEDFIVNTTGDKIAYNFDYFGDYYIPSGEPQPSDFEPYGHKYDGIGIYNILTKKDLKLSGKNKPTGFVIK